MSTLKLINIKNIMKVIYFMRYFFCIGMVIIVASGKINASEENYFYYNFLRSSHEKDFGSMGILITTDGLEGTISFPVRFIDEEGKEVRRLTSATTLDICDTSDKYVCFFSDTYTFAVPKNIGIPYKQWSYRSFVFKVVGYLKIPGTRGEIFQIDVYSIDQNRRVWRILYNKYKGMYLIAEYLEGSKGEEGFFDNVFFSPTRGFGALEK